MFFMGIKMVSQCKLILFLSLPLLLNSFSFAAEKSPQPRDERFDDQLELAKPSLSSTNPQVSDKRKDKHTLSIAKEELSKHPDLIVRGLITAVLQNNGEAVQLLLPLYQNLPKQDPFLLEWANAINAREERRFSEAVTRYRTLFSQDSTILPLRYQLAQALFLNNDNEAAKDQFQKLRAEQVSPESIVMIDQYLSALNLRDQWKFQGGLSFLNESNINNAPKAGTRIGNWSAWERESATGFSYFAEAEKKWSLPHNYFTKFSIEGSGKYYWDNKKYNEFNGRVGAGLGYQTARFEISLMPFTERRWYAGGSSGSESMKQYSKNSGARLDLTYWLNEKWQISTALEYGEQRYNTRKHLNGNNYLWSNTLSYFPKSGQSWFVGADYNRENTRDKDNAYQRKNLRLGWGQEWGWGISTRISLAYARRTYKGADLFNIRQKNNEYQSAVTLWHRDLYFWGITPKITWSYQRVSSNHPFYSYDKNRIFLEMGKTF